MSGSVQNTTTASNKGVGGLVGYYRVAADDNSTELNGDATSRFKIADTTLENMTVKGIGNNVGGMVGLIEYGNGGNAVEITIENKTDGTAVQSSVTVEGSAQVGGVVGALNITGGVKTANITGEITIKANSHATVSSTTGAYVGGTIGYLPIANANGTINFSIASDNQGNITSKTNSAGGLIGYINLSGAGTSTIKIGTTNKAQYGTGTVSATTAAGGIVGKIDYGKAATLSFYAGPQDTGVVKTTSGNNAGGVVGELNVNAAGTINFNYAENNSSNANKRVSNLAAVTSAADNAGGIVGYLYNESTGTGNTVSVGGTNNANVTGTTEVGGVVGYMIYTKATTSGSFTVSGTHSSGKTVSGTTNVGGVVGSLVRYTAGAANCTASISGTNSGTVGADSSTKVGGIVGYIVSASGAGAGNATTVGGTNGGTVKGATYIGGIIGMAQLETSGATLTMSGTPLNQGTVGIAGTSEHVGGIVGELQWAGAIGTAYNLSGVKNTGTVQGKNNVGGHIGQLDSASPDTDAAAADATAFNATISTTNSATVTGSSGYVGGLVGMINFNNTATTTVDITGSNTKDVVSASANGVGGLVGGATFNSTASATLKFAGRTNSKAVTGKNNVGGFIGHINVASGSGAAVSITQGTNTGAITGGQSVGGIIGRYETAAASTPASFLIEKTRNAGTITSTNSTEARAGGIVGMYYQLSTNAINSKITICWNNGAVNAAGKAVGGIVGFFINKSTSPIVEHCLNSASLTTTLASNPADIGGIIGDNYYQASDTGTGFTLRYCYNVGSITAGSGATYVGPIVGRKCSGLSATNVYYETATSANGSGVGTKMTELSYVSLNADVKANWVYSQEYDRIELYYFHDLLNNHSSLPVYRWEVSGGNICYYCESINCPKVLSQVPASGISAVIYVRSNGYTQANSDPAALGSKSYPCKTLEIANECVERNKLAGAAATKVVIMDTVTVPSDYRLPAATSGTMILTANDGTTAYSGVLSFTNPSKYDGARHFHIDGATLIENITINNDSISGVYFYAENRSLTMGDGITMTSTNPYYVEDYYGKTAEGVNIYTYAGARVHVIGGYSINDWMHQNLSAADIAKFDGYLSTFNSYFAEQKAGGALNNEAEALTLLEGYIGELAAALPAPPVVNSNIVVKSGNYRAISGWHDDFLYVNRNANTYEGINYSVPLTGTANVTVGSSTAGKLQVTHLSPLGVDYQSYGENATANVNVNGDVVLWSYSLGAQLNRMCVRYNGKGAPIGENRYPLINNITLNGNLRGPDGTVVDSVNPLTAYYWGFNLNVKPDFAILANVTVGSGAEAIKDAHAFLGHGSYCSNAGCTASAPEDITDYVHRSIVNMGVCTCGGAAVASGDNLSATCITYAMNRMVCGSCGKYKSAEIPQTVLNPDYHVQKMQLKWLNLMSQTPNGVKVTHDGDCRCFNGRISNIISDGTFYVSEKQFTGEADYYVPGIGTIDQPFNDFMTAYRVALAYSGDKTRAGKIVIIDKATWDLTDGGTTNSISTPHLGGAISVNMDPYGKIEISGKTASSKLLFKNDSSKQNSMLLVTNDLKFSNIALEAEHKVMASDSTKAHRVRIYGRNNILEMGTGITMPGSYTTYGDEAGTVNFNNFMVFGGFNADPSDSSNPNYKMDTNLTVRSGVYYYIGAWNSNAVSNSSRDGKVAGSGLMRVGATGNDTLVTRFLSAYGVDAETTVNTTVDIYIDGRVNAQSLEPTAQNGTILSGGGAMSEGNRITNIHLSSDADLNIDRVHMSNDQIRGKYTVNVFVENSATNPSLDAVHKLCGHDKGLTNGRGVKNYRHINTFHPICDEATCTFAQKTSDTSSYLLEAPTVLDVASDIDVNVYDTARYVEHGEPTFTFEENLYGEADSGCYYVDKAGNPLTIDHRGTPLGVVRFLFDIAMFSNVPTLDQDFRYEFIEESYVRFIFNDVEGDKMSGTGEGRAPTFRVDVYKIPEADASKVYYAAGYIKLYDEAAPRRVLVQGSANFERPVLYQY